jgi:hypothetical protein
MDDGVGDGQIETGAAGLEADQKERHLDAQKARDRFGAVGRFAAHQSPGTTKLDDRTKERLTQDEVERIRL